MPALFEAMDLVLTTQRDKLAIQHRITADMREIWAMQPRFERRNGRMPFKLLEHPRFRAAYDFVLLRAASGEIEHEIADWWTTFQEADPDARNQMTLAQKGSGRSGLGNSHSTGNSAGVSMGSSVDPAKRKRRRRRKPEGGAESPAAAATTTPARASAPSGE